MHINFIMDKIDSVNQSESYLVTKSHLNRHCRNAEKIKHMNDNEKGGMHARMMAEQAVARMDGQLRWRMDKDARDGLVEAIVKTGSPDKFLFRPEPFRAAPPRWSLSGFIARGMFFVQRKRGITKGSIDVHEALAATHYKIKRSGAVGLVITLLIALLVGITGVGEPVEIGLQMGRDAARRTAASGDIVVIAKDDRSAKLFGGMPWKRRYDAQLVDRLREMGAKRIVFDRIMADPSDPIDDVKLAEAFDRAKGNVWLAITKEMNSKTRKFDAITPIPLFLNKTRQSHIWVTYGMFGNIQEDIGTSFIGNNSYPSLAAVIAGTDSQLSAFQPDYAIDYKSIPTISAADLVLNNVKKSDIHGKTVVISVVSDISASTVPILGQGRAPGIYSAVIAAETINSGLIRELGYIFPLLICVIIGSICITNNHRRHRAVFLISGLIAILIFMFVGDRLRLHVEMIPALLALSIMAVREATRNKMIEAMTTNEMTGLPNLSHLKFIKGYQKSAVVAIKIERYAQFIGRRPYEEQKVLLRAIVARINVIAPGCLVHQGDDGLFAFLIHPDSGIYADPLPGQLHALFTQNFVAINGLQRIGISVGINDDIDATFDVRLAVAIDRAEFSEFVTLQAVQ
jgi:diguanylate cyclase